MSRAVIHESFGGPEVLEIHEIQEPHAAEGEVRIKVSAAGLNPIDWGLSSKPDLAERFGYSIPSGFGHDFAGVIDEVGDNVEGFHLGDRVYGGALGKAVADFVVIKPSTGTLTHTPDAISDEVATTLPIAGLTAVAALDAINVKSGDTLLVGGACGGVGVFVVQLAKLAGAVVIGTCSKHNFEFLEQLGALPVQYGPGLADRVKILAPDGISAATDLFGTETVEAALDLGVAPDRISTIAAGPNPPGGVRSTGGGQAQPGSLERITDAIIEGKLTVPITARFPLEKIRDAVTLQSGRHVRGKIVITL